MAEVNRTHHPKNVRSAMLACFLPICDDSPFARNFVSELPKCSGADMAHKKGQGSSRNGRDSQAKRLGIKKFGGEQVIAGNIICRQNGTKWRPGRNVGLGRDYTIYSLVDGQVFFDQEGRRINVAISEVVAAEG